MLPCIGDTTEAVCKLGNIILEDVGIEISLACGWVTPVIDNDELIWVEGK